jgi:hypothetical protein
MGHAAKGAVVPSPAAPEPPPSRALRSALHGFASLEAAGGFGLPRDVNRSYRFLVDTLITGLQTDRPDHSTAPEDRHDHRPPTQEDHETTR